MRTTKQQEEKKQPDNFSEWPGAHLPLYGPEKNSMLACKAEIFIWNTSDEA